MADVKVNDRSSERTPASAGDRERGGVTHRGERAPSRDIYSVNPFTLMRRLSDEMDRALSSTFGLWPSQGVWGEHSAGWFPAIEVKEKDNKLLVCADLPGMKKEDIKVEVTDEGLTIEGERKREHEEERSGYRHSERSYGHFYRTIPLPEGAQTDKVNAQFKDGVLEVTIPVPENQRNKRRSIPIGT